MSPVDRGRKYQVLAYGIEAKGLSFPDGEFSTTKCRLVFLGRREAPRFDEFDAVILFQGTFERFEFASDGYRQYLRHFCYRDELDKRTKEISTLLEKGGLACFLLCERFIDKDNGHDYRDSDLSKRFLNSFSIDREPFPQRVTSLRCHLEDFSKFFRTYAAAFAFLRPPYSDKSLKVLGSYGHYTVAVSARGQLFFIPTLLPESSKAALEEFFTELTDALVATWEKLREELPAWVDDFRFQEEETALTRRAVLVDELEQIDTRVAELRRFKGVLVYQGEALVDSVIWRWRRDWA